MNPPPDEHNFLELVNENRNRILRKSGAAYRRKISYSQPCGDVNEPRHCERARDDSAFCWFCVGAVLAGSCAPAEKVVENSSTKQLTAAIGFLKD